jgi:hypothetical protein
MTSPYPKTDTSQSPLPEGLTHAPAALSFLVGTADFLLLNAAFFALNYWKRETLELSPIYFKLLLAFYGIWLLVSLGTKKFRLRPQKGYWHAVRAIWKAGAYLVYSMAVIIVLMELYAFSRAHVFGTCLLFILLEWALFSAFYRGLLRSGPPPLADRANSMRDRAGFRVPLAVADFFLVGISFFVVNYLKRDGLHLLPEYEHLLLLIYGLWFMVSLVTHKFEQRHHLNFYHAFWPWMKAAILLFFTLALAVFLFRLTHFSRTQVFGPVMLLLFLEGILCAFYCRITQGKEEQATGDPAALLFPRDGDTSVSPQEKAMLAASALIQEEIPCTVDFDKIRSALMAPVRKRFRDSTFQDNPDLFAFLDETLDLSDIIHAETVLRHSVEIFHLDPVDGRPIRLFINLHKLNDIRRLNEYFLEVHHMLAAGGHFVGNVHTIQTHREWMFQKYPRLMAHVFYAVDFLIHRVAPKIPKIKKAYFFLTKGKSRRISRAEVLGRLSFCGFRIVAEKEINQRLYVVAHKMLTPSLNKNPTYGPFVQLKRIGENGKVLSIYKFRTMHPYSEFLQDYVYRIQGLQKGGKLENDFRVTTWGKMMRSLWLDELPMLYNWLKGDLQVFGVRPLSYQYLSLYPSEVQALRMLVKPGLVPPFYADMPETFEEICESEKRYVEAYLKRPVRTQVVYFWRAFHNIVFKGARSK